MKKILSQLVEAFKIIQELLHSKKMLVLAQTLAPFLQAKTAEEIAALEIIIPPSLPHLSPLSWRIVGRLSQIAMTTRLILDPQRTCLTRTAALTRSLGDLRNILTEQTPPPIPYPSDWNDPVIDHYRQIPTKIRMPRAERDLILTITRNWEAALERIASDIEPLT